MIFYSFLIYYEQKTWCKSNMFLRVASIRCFVFATLSGEGGSVFLIRFCVFLWIVEFEKNSTAPRRERQNTGSQERFWKQLLLEVVWKSNAQGSPISLTNWWKTGCQVFGFESRFVLKTKRFFERFVGTQGDVFQVYFWLILNDFGTSGVVEF